MYVGSSAITMSVRWVWYKVPSNWVRKDNTTNVVGILWDRFGSKSNVQVQLTLS